MIAIDNFDDEVTPSHIFIGGIDNNREYLYKFDVAGEASGVYTSPIFSLDNKYNASYFITDGTTESGTSSISYNENVYNGTIRVRSSDTKPLDADEVFLPYAVATTYISKHVIYNGNEEVPWVNVAASLSVPYSLAVNRRNGDVVISYYGTSYYGTMRKYDKNGVELYKAYSHSHKYSFNVDMECDKFGGIWGYGDGVSAMSLIHWDNELD